MDFSNLAYTVDSINKLTEIINVSTSSDEILEASFYLAKINYELKNYDDSIKVIVKNINNDVKKANYDLYHKFYDLIIEIYTSTYNLNDAIKWINKKRENTAVFDMYKADILLLEVYKKDGDLVKSIALANKILTEQIDALEKTNILKFLIEVNLKDEKYDDALVFIRKLKENTYELDSYNYYYALYYEAYSSYKIGEYKTALKLNNECIDNRMFITDELSVKVYVLDLMIYIGLKEYKKAILKESEYESTILDSTYDNKVEFFNACIKLYTEEYNKPSLELYKERLALLEKPNDDVRQKIRIDLKPVKLKDETPVKQDVKEVDKPSTYNIINSIISLEESVLLKGIKPKLRDNILSVLDSVNELVQFDVCVIVLNNRAFSGFYYKKNRLYEKEYRDIKNTVIYDVIKHKKEQIYPSRDELYGKRDIYLDNLYENTDISNVIAFPVMTSDKVNAVIYYYTFEETLSLGYNFELLKLSSMLIGDRIINKDSLEELRLENSSYQKAFMEADIPLKFMSSDDIYLNNKAKELLNQKSKLKLNEYMINISNEDYKPYKEFLTSNVEEFKYRFDELDIVEKKKNIGTDIISILNNNSLFAKLERKENDLIYLDSETRVKNMYSLKKDLDEFIKKEKFSILQLNIKTYSRIVDCYGSEYSSRVIRNTAMYLKEFFNSEYIYHFNRDEFYVIVDGINDSRTIEKKCLELIDYLRLNVNKNVSRIEARYNVGALRYRSQTLVKDIELILDYVGFALKMASISSNSFAYYDQDSYKEDFNKTSMTANINEAIDTNKIGVCYNQVVDLKNSTTSFYRINPIIPSLNITKEEILNIVQLRGLQFKLEILMIRKSISEILKVYDKKKKYVRISLNITYDTLLHKDFISFMKRLIVDNKLPKGLVIFDLNGKRKDIKKEVDELNRMGVRFMSANIEDAMYFDINYFRVSYLLPHLNTDKGKLVLESLRQMSEPLNMKLIIDGVSPSELSYVREHDIDLASYGKELLLDDILKKMED